MGRDLVPATPQARPEDEGFVRRGFWSKIAKILGRVPFVEDVVAAFFCATDPATPGRVRAVLFGALAYFIVPTDMIPDFVAGLGFTDDASVILAAITMVGPHIKGRHRARAQSALNSAALNSAALNSAALKTAALKQAGRRGWSRSRPGSRAPTPPRAG